MLTNAFMADRNEDTKAFAERFKERHGKNPTMVQAGVYSAVLHYLKGVEATGSDEASAVMEWMKANPSNDPVFGEATVRKDGRHMHDMYLLKVKSPDAAESEEDYFELLATIPAEEAFRPIEDGDCEMAKQ